MKVTFANPSVGYMTESIMAFQTDGETAFWTEPLYYFYPQLDRTHAAGLSFAERKEYIECIMRTVYKEKEDIINKKVELYSKQWDTCERQISDALSDAFALNCDVLLNDIRCNVSLNPISPRFLKERRYDVFYLNSEQGAIGMSIHEIIHFVWFYVWQRTFNDGFNEYERPSLKWILSEMVVESIMSDKRLSSVNPYFPRERGGCIYPYFFDMIIDGKPILDTINIMYRSQNIEDFMRCSYENCRKHEAEIREHIKKSEFAGNQN